MYSNALGGMKYEMFLPTETALRIKLEEISISGASTN